MKTILLASLLAFTTSSFASMVFYNSSGAKVGIVSKAKCGTGLTCAITSGKLVLTPAMTAFTSGDFTGAVTGDGGDALYGFLQNTVAATATTITAAQCGSTFKNSGAVQINLPEASTVIGCRLTFITANAANFDVNPDDADQILVQTNAAGDMIRNATLGNSITLQAISASEWAPVSVVGTWADAN